MQKNMINCISNVSATIVLASLMLAAGCGSMETGNKTGSFLPRNLVFPEMKTDIVNINEGEDCTISLSVIQSDYGSIPSSKKVKLQMIWIEPGMFTMGSPEDELGRWNNETQHEVTLTQGYWLSKYEVTRELWSAVMGEYDSDRGNLPVVVTYDEALEFCRRLTEKEIVAGVKLPVGYEYTLPTEAQWEYACRAGTTTALNSGEDITTVNGFCEQLDVVGWYGSIGNAGGDVHLVGQKLPNAWGFHDMHGNVWEWCLDWYGDYPTEAATDPTGPDTGLVRVARGGGWYSRPGECRSACRSYGKSNDLRIGFRVALTAGVDSCSDDGYLTRSRGIDPEGRDCTENKMQNTTSHIEMEKRSNFKIEL